jgi:hypothetical protein
MKPGAIPPRIAHSAVGSYSTPAHGPTGDPLRIRGDGRLSLAGRNVRREVTTMTWITYEGGTPATAIPLARVDKPRKPGRPRPEA